MLSYYYDSKLYNNSTQFSSPGKEEGFEGLICPRLASLGPFRPLAPRSGARKGAAGLELGQANAF